MAHNGGNFYGQGNPRYLPPPGYGPPNYFPPPAPGYSAPPGYSLVPLPPPPFPTYGFQPSPYCAPPPPMPFHPPNGNYNNNARRPYKDGNNQFSNRGRQNFRHPNGNQQNWNDNGGRKRKFNNNASQNEYERKPKIDKRDLPENNKYSCDICNRGFKTEEQYKIHVDAHIKCSFEGCNFTAHEKLVQTHIEHVHLSGYADKLESSNDVEQWIEERKRNFLTKEKMEKIKKEREEALERGEVPATRGKGKSWVDRRRGRGRFHNNNHRATTYQAEDWNGTHQQPNATAIPQAALKASPAPVMLENPTSRIDHVDPSESSSSSEGEEEEVEESKVALPVVERPSEPEGEPKDAPEEKSSKQEPTSEVPVAEASHSTNDRPVPRSGEKNQRQNRNKAQHRPPPRKREPLARALMERDIKREMNVMLQVAAFFVKKMQEVQATLEVISAQGIKSEIRDDAEPGRRLPSAVDLDVVKTEASEDEKEG